MADLRSKPSMGAMRWSSPFCAGRVAVEVRLARWVEIDFNSNSWTIPAERMKMKKEHRVPLSMQAIELLRSILPETVRPDDLIFPGERAGQPLSDMTPDRRHPAQEREGF